MSYRQTVIIFFTSLEGNRFICHDGGPKVPGVEDRRDGRVFLEYPGDVRVEETIPCQAEAAPPVHFQISGDGELKERHFLYTHKPSQVLPVTSAILFNT